MSLLGYACGFRTWAYAGKAAGDAQGDNQGEVRYRTAAGRANAGEKYFLCGCAPPFQLSEAEGLPGTCRSWRLHGLAASESNKAPIWAFYLAFWLRVESQAQLPVGTRLGEDLVCFFVIGVTATASP